MEIFRGTKTKRWYIYRDKKTYSNTFKWDDKKYLSA